MGLIVPFSVVLGLGALSWGLLRMVASDKGPRDVRALVIVFIAMVLLSASLWWLSSLL